MVDQRITDAFEGLAPSQEAKQRMLTNILASAPNASKHRRVRAGFVVRIVVPLAACLVIVSLLNVAVAPQIFKQMANLASASPGISAAGFAVTSASSTTSATGEGADAAADTAKEASTAAPSAAGGTASAVPSAPGEAASATAGVSDKATELSSEAEAPDSAGSMPQAEEARAAQVVTTQVQRLPALTDWQNIMLWLLAIAVITLPLLLFASLLVFFLLRRYRRQLRFLPFNSRNDH